MEDGHGRMEGQPVAGWKDKRKEAKKDGMMQARKSKSKTPRIRPLFDLPLTQSLKRAPSRKHSRKDGKIKGWDLFTAPNPSFHECKDARVVLYYLWYTQVCWQKQIQLHMYSTVDKHLNK